MAWNTGFEAEGMARPQPGEVLARSTAGIFMARVYRWMFGGLALTAATALYTATNPALLHFVIGARMLLLVAQLGVVLGLSFLAQRLSGAMAAALFLAYSVLTGLTFSLLLLAFPAQAVVQAFAVSAVTFGAMSLYGTVTKKDLSSWGAFLFIGLIGVVVASLVQIFVKSDMLSFVISCAAVVVFAGLTAYDNQKLRNFYYAQSGYSSALSLSIIGALTLYLDFINLFIALLQLFGRRRN